MTGWESEHSKGVGVDWRQGHIFLYINSTLLQTKELFFMINLEILTLMTGWSRNTVRGSVWSEVKVTSLFLLTVRYFLVHMWMILHCCSHFSTPPEETVSIKMFSKYRRTDFVSQWYEFYDFQVDSNNHRPIWLNCRTVIGGRGKEK